MGVTGLQSDASARRYDMAGADPFAAALEREGRLGRTRWSFVSHVHRRVYGWGFAANENSPTAHPTGSATAPTPSGSTRRGTTSWTGHLQRAPFPALGAAPGEGFPAAYLHRIPGRGRASAISMTCGAIPTIRLNGKVAAEWEEKVVSRKYDPSFGRPREDRCPRRHGHDREAGRVRRQANTTNAVPTATDGEYRITGHKWFMSAPMRCPSFSPSTRRALVFPGTPLHTGRPGQLPSPPASQGQAGQPLQRVVRGRVRGRLGCDGGGRGARCRRHHRDGRPHASRLCHRVGGADASGGHAGHPPHAPPLCVRLTADRQAADAKRARRSRGGDGGRRAPHDEGGRILRSIPARRPRGSRQASPHTRRQVLGDQAMQRSDAGGDGVPRRERLRRGVDHAASVSGVPGQRHLGGEWERDRPRCGPGPRQGACMRQGPAQRAGRGPRPRLPSRRHRPRLREPRHRRAEAGARIITERMALASGALLRGTPRPRSTRRSPPADSTATGVISSARCLPASTSRRSSSPPSRARDGNPGYLPCL